MELAHDCRTQAGHFLGEPPFEPVGSAIDGDGDLVRGGSQHVIAPFASLGIHEFKQSDCPFVAETSTEGRRYTIGRHGTSILGARPPSTTTVPSSRTSCQPCFRLTRARSSRGFPWRCS